MALEAGVSCEEIDAIEEKGITTEEEAKNACCTVTNRLPEGELKEEAMAYIEGAWGEDCGC